MKKLVKVHWQIESNDKMKRVRFCKWIIIINSFTRTISVMFLSDVSHMEVFEYLIWISIRISLLISPSLCSLCHLLYFFCVLLWMKGMWTHKQTMGFVMIHPISVIAFGDQVKSHTFSFVSVYLCPAFIIIPFHHLVVNGYPPFEDCCTQKSFQSSSSFPVKDSRWRLNVCELKRDWNTHIGWIELNHLI